MNQLQTPSNSDTEYARACALRRTAEAGCDYKAYADAAFAFDALHMPCAAEALRVRGFHYLKENLENIFTAAADVRS
jgi:hypothetical protein